MSEHLKELKNIVEAALFSSDTALTIKRIVGTFPRGAAPAKEDVGKALELLRQDYAERGVELRKVGNAYRFQTRQEYASWLGKLAESRPPRYSRALLETLAIIAYRQPVTRGDIEDIRGVTVSTDIMRTLLDREWIKQVGTRDVPGHPALFGTTREFLAYFNLGSLKDLPDLNVERDITEIARELNVDLPLFELQTGQESGNDSQDVDDGEHDLDLLTESNKHANAMSDVYEDVDDADSYEEEEFDSADITESNKVAVAADAGGGAEIDEEVAVTTLGD